MSVSWEIREGDALERLADMPDESVQCCVTSPPYFGLRDYGTGEWEGGEAGCDHRGPPQQSQASTLLGNGHGGDKQLSPSLQAQRQPFGSECGKCGARRVDRQIGLERSPDEFVARLVEVFRGVRRVLRTDGTLWLNIGDSYSPNWSSQRASGGGGFKNNDRKRWTRLEGYKPKDLLGIPWLLAFALRADGWYLRSDVIWAKPNPMPESVTDRPTSAHEHVFLLAKSPRYFYDADAIRESDSGHASGNGFAGRQDHRLSGGLAVGGTVETWQPGGGRNKRDVWTVPDELWSQFLRWLDEQQAELPDVWRIVTQAFPGSHFATFPPKLIEPCILAGSSPKACGVCGAPWERVVERLVPKPAAMRPKDPRVHLGHSSKSTINQSNWHDDRNPERSTRTIGWQPSCVHDDDDGSSVILDPFAGAGTTGLVALRHDRSFIGIELNPSYAEMARERIRQDAPLLNTPAEAVA